MTRKRRLVATMVVVLGGAAGLGAWLLSRPATDGDGGPDTATAVVSSTTTDVPTSVSVPSPVSESPPLTLRDPTTLASVTVVDTEVEPPTVSVLPPVIVPLDWSGDSIDTKVLAVRPNNPGFAVVDLSEGVMKVYPPGSHHVPRDAVCMASITPSGDILVYSTSHPHVFLIPDGDFSVPPTILKPSRVARSDGFVEETGIWAQADQSGSLTWLLQYFYNSSHAHSRYVDYTLIELVNNKTGEIVTTTQLDGDYYRVGLLDDALFVASDRGGAVLDQDGTLTPITTYSDDHQKYGWLAVYRRWLAYLSHDKRNLIIADVDTNQTHTLTVPGSGTWSPVILPDIPAQRIWANSDEIIVEYRKDPMQPPDSVYVVGLADQTARLIYVQGDDPPSSAIGIVDGALLVGTEVLDEGLTLSAIQYETGSWQTLVNLPEGYFVFDVG